MSFVSLHPLYPLITLYNKKVIQHFSNPKFFGKIKDPDAIGESGNPRCGDLLTLYLKVDEKTGKITDVKFETLGCAAAIAASDMICELAKNKKLNEAEKISFKDVSRELGVLPPLKIHCAQLVTEALGNAIKNYKKNQEKK